ncbi:hypothetical protein D9C73_008110 [Collichthys lucidus]|nr:hypothetical protein D9C73_008110 [Collichthys lucidus]
MKPLPQRRAVSVHEDTLAMTQELKAVLQRSPIRFRVNRGDLPPCTEDTCSSGTEKETAGEKEESFQKEELKAERGRTGCGGTGGETKHPPPGEDEAPGSWCPSSTANAQKEVSAPRLFSPPAVTDKALSILERPPTLSQTPEKHRATPTTQKESSSTTPTLPQTLEKLLVSPPPQDKIPSTITAASASPENPQVSPLSHKEPGPGIAPATEDLRNSTQERGEVVFKQHTTKAEPADQRTELPLSE